jgi:peptidoglycan/xylan/chitin deacetylase (PgdA/CDA1 family)
MTDLESTREAVRRARDQVAALDAERLALETELNQLDLEIERLSGSVADRRACATHVETRRERPNRGAILLYHRIATLDPDPFGLCVAPEHFRAHMELLARSFNPMPLDDLVECTRSGDIPARAVSVTFDDGYLDAFVASDIMTGLQIPATFYLNSSARQEAWHDSVARIFLGSHDLPPQLEIALAGATISLSTAGPHGRHAALDAVREIGWTLLGDARADVIEALAQWGKVDLTPRPSHRLLMPQEVRELANRPGHSIGAHTANHPFLPAHQRKTKLQEIAVNRRFLEELVGEPVSSFAYPYGGFDSEAVELCRGMGFRSAVTVVGRAVRPWDDLLLLPRSEIKAQTVTDFEAFVARLFA